MKMELQAYELYIPYIVGDTIKRKSTNDKYELLDILHTYSANKQTIVSVDFRIVNLETDEITLVPYKQDEWEIIKK